MKKLTLCFTFAMVSLAAQRFSHNPKLSDDLAQADPQSQVDVLVQWKQIPTDQHHQKVISRGGKIRRRFSKVASSAYSIPASALSDLANDPDVAFIAPDRPIRAKLDYTAAAVNAPTAWNSNLTGAGIVVAVIDSGISANADFNGKGRIIYSQDFAGGSASGADLFGHGQHVAGILGASGANSNCSTCTRTLKGIAPGVNIVNLRALDVNGSGSDSTVIAAIDQAISLASTYHIRVINLSVGRPVYESYQVDPLCQAVEFAWHAGIVVVVAAGNDGRDNFFGTSGYGTINAPGNDPYVITVGAMKTAATYPRTDDQIASYSSKGPTLVDAIVKPDLVAPGNQVVSLLAAPNETLALQNPTANVPHSYYQRGGSNKPANTYLMLSGTSMATPVVSGAAALLLQANPAMTPDQVKARLMLNAYKTFPVSSVATDPTTGQTFVSYYDVFTVGAGYLDIAAALADKSLAQGTAMSPTAVYNKATGAIGMVTDPSAVWTFGNIWGNSTIFDVRSVWATNAIVDLRSVWATSAIADLRSVWATSAVNAANTVWGNNTVWGVGLNVNQTPAASMTSAAGIQPSSITTAQSASLSIGGAGEN